MSGKYGPVSKNRQKAKAWAAGGDKQSETQLIMKMLAIATGLCTLIGSGFGGASYLVLKSDYHRDRAEDKELRRIEREAQHEREMAMMRSQLGAIDDFRLEFMDYQLNRLLIIPERKRTELQRQQVIELQANRELLLMNIKANLQ